ncbi:MAG: hypothetical protein H7Y36_09210 [Armatimonadetes bacterium]|nr:hypothetical protein [Akkermansiaceae bacterium]
MKNLFRNIAFSAFLGLPLGAQEPEKFGFLNIVNLIPHEKSCDIEIGGKQLVPAGLKSGTDTGWFVVPAGKKSISISLTDLDGASGEIELIDNVSSLVAIYLQPDPRRKTDGKPFPPKIRIKSFSAYDTKAFGLKFVSLCPKDNRFQIGPHKLDLKQFQSEDIPNWTGGGFEILHNGKSVGNVPGNQEKGSYYLLVATDHQGKFASVITNCDKQQLPPWMKKDPSKAAPPAVKSTPSQP